MFLPSSRARLLRRKTCSSGDALLAHTEIREPSWVSVAAVTLAWVPQPSGSPPAATSQTCEESIPAPHIGARVPNHRTDASHPPVPSWLHRRMQRRPLAFRVAP